MKYYKMSAYRQKADIEDLKLVLSECGKTIKINAVKYVKGIDLKTLYKYLKSNNITNKLKNIENSQETGRN